MKLVGFKKHSRFLLKGFTLIELLIVIAILGVLAAGLLVLIDPIDKIRQANDAQVKNDISAAGRAAEAYATLHNGFYPNELADLYTSGELKRTPAAPSGYAAYSSVIGLPVACVEGSTCTGVLITGTLRSKQYTDTPRWLYNSKNGKSCAVEALVSECP